MNCNDSTTFINESFYRHLCGAMISVSNNSKKILLHHLINIQNQTMNTVSSYIINFIHVILCNNIDIKTNLLCLISRNFLGTCNNEIR